MDFVKYQHIERFGTDEVDGIEFGECYIFPKIDGTNSSAWIDEDCVLCAGSRNRELTLDNDNQGFFEYISQDARIEKFFEKYNGVRLFGEWLVPHSLKTYRADAWRKFYVFDVMNNKGEYIPFDEYELILKEFHLDYIPPLAIIKNPTYERLISWLDRNQFLVEDGKGAGEGVVIKNYKFKNRFGRTTWAKIVTSEFKEKHTKEMGAPRQVESALIEERIAEKYITSALIEKTFEKIRNESGWTSKMIPRLLSTVYHNLIAEETWNFVKEFKNPKIDFKRLMQITTMKIKEVKPELF